MQYAYVACLIIVLATCKWLLALCRFNKFGFEFEFEFAGLECKLITGLSGGKGFFSLSSLYEQDINNFLSSDSVKKLLFSFKLIDFHQLVTLDYEHNDGMPFGSDDWYKIGSHVNAMNFTTSM